MLNGKKKGCTDSSFMRTFTDNETLTDAALDRLGDISSNHARVARR